MMLKMGALEPVSVDSFEENIRNKEGHEAHFGCKVEHLH